MLVDFQNPRFWVPNSYRNPGLLKKQVLIKNNPLTKNTSNNVSSNHKKIILSSHQGVGEVGEAKSHLDQI